MKFPRFARCLVMLLGAFAGVPLPAAPDARLAGYWVTPPSAPQPAAFTFSIFGKWTIVSPHLPGVPDSRIRYTVESTGNTGMLTMDEPPDKQPSAPRTIRYGLQAGELTLEFPGAAPLLLVKGVPPSSRPPAQATPKPAPAKPTQVAPKPGPGLLGGWTTEPGVEKQLILFISRSQTADVKINQQWTKGSENPNVSRNTDYSVTFANNRGTMAMTKPAYEGSLIPPVLNFSFEGNAMVIMIDDGHYAGQYRLIPQTK